MEETAKAQGRVEPATIIDGVPYVRCCTCERGFTRHNGSTDLCDMDYGPCACGGWHSGEHRCPECREWR